MQHQQDKPRYCGVDFGTSNSTVGLMTDGSARLCPLEAENVTLPSALFFDFDDGSTHFGRDAICSYVDGARGRFMRALKSVLGSGLVRERTQLGVRRITMAEVIGTYLGHLKLSAERYVGRELDSVVLGRPVRFVDGDDAADRSAEAVLVQIARNEGFKNVELQYEPVAAALTYESQLEREELALIVDIGGGTSDFAITRLSPDRSRQADRVGDILGRSGVHIGGTDFDRYLNLNFVMPHLGSTLKYGTKNLQIPRWLFHDLATWHRIWSVYQSSNLTYLNSIAAEVDDIAALQRLLDVLVNHDGHRIATEVEATKIELSGNFSANIDLSFLKGLSVSVDRSDLEGVLMSPLSSLVDALLECFATAAIKPSQVGSVFLTGGSTAIPIVRQQILGVLPSVRVVEGDVFGSVGLGLAMEARRRFG